MPIPARPPVGLVGRDLRGYDARDDLVPGAHHRRRGLVAGTLDAEDVGVGHVAGFQFIVFRNTLKDCIPRCNLWRDFPAHLLKLDFVDLEVEFGRSPLRPKTNFPVLLDNRATRAFISTDSPRPARSHREAVDGPLASPGARKHGAPSLSWYHLVRCGARRASVSCSGL